MLKSLGGRESTTIPLLTYSKENTKFPLKYLVNILINEKVKFTFELIHKKTDTGHFDGVENKTTKIQ